MSDMRHRTVEVNDATYTAWNSHDPDAVAGIFAEDAVLREAGSANVLRGRDAIRERAQMLLTAFPDLHLQRIDLVIDGERHADRWLLTGTHHGELFGIAPTGRTIRVEGATFSRMGEHGLVVEDIHFVDAASLFAQLGVS